MIPTGVVYTDKKPTYLLPGIQPCLPSATDTQYSFLSADCQSKPGAPGWDQDEDALGAAGLDRMVVQLLRVGAP